MHTRILLALVAGAAFGFAANQLEFSGFVITYIRPVGTAFIKLISMVVVPLVFVALLVGTASLKDIRSLGRIGIRTLLLYVSMTAIAVTIGLTLANLVEPGKGFTQETKQQLKQGAAAQADAAIAGASAAREKTSVVNLLLNIIPANPVRSLAEGQMLQVIFFAVLMGICLTLIPPERAKPVTAFFEGANEIFVKMVHVIMLIAPYGVFALVAAVVADFGLGIIWLLFKYCLTVLAGLLIYMLVVYSAILKFLARTGVRRFFRGLRPAQLVAFSSSSSAATLPVTLKCVTETLGVPQGVASFMLSVGASINMDGTALYQGVATVFIAQFYGIDLGFGQQLMVVLTATMAALGTVGIPGAGVVMLLMVLNSVGVPPEGIGIILGVDRFLDMCRTAVNVTGDSVCTMVIAAAEGQLDNNAAQKKLGESGEPLKTSALP
ncbi:MAG: dicarboxylate/amino acid:cation symporter [Planctomycetes bacterium]|jgi:Na+/H+-dicarboxylate symporter|nr:dicarboxylate/amino acid:cation symporter [Planctomycetota bacterium]